MDILRSILNFAVETGQDLLVTIIAGALTVIALIVTTKANQFFDNLLERFQVDKSSKHAELQNQIMERVRKLTIDTVWGIEGAVAKNLRKAVKEGKANPEELAKYGRLAVEEILQELGDNGRQILEETVGDSKQYVQRLVDGYVEKIKKDYEIPEGLKDKLNPPSSSHSPQGTMDQGIPSSG